MSDARGQEIRAGSQHCGVITDLKLTGVAFDEARLRTNMMQEICIGAGSAEDANRAAVTGRIATGVVQGLHTAFQKYALLRVDQRGFRRKDSEVRCVKHFGAGKNRFRTDCIGTAWYFQFVRFKEGGGFNPVAEVIPKFPDVAGSWKAAGHSNNGDVSRIRRRV